MSQYPPPPPPGATPPPPPRPPAGTWPAAGPPGGPAGGDPRRPALLDRARLDAVPNPYPLWTAVIALLVFSGPNLVVVALGGLDADTSGMETTTGFIVFSLVFSLVLQAIIFGIALLPLLVTRRLDRRLWGPMRTSWSVVWIGLGAGVVTALLAYTLNGIAAFLVGAEDPVEQQLLQDALAGGIALALVFVLAVVVAPLVEEVLFRGVLFRALLERTGMVVAAAVSAALFAVVHVEVVFSQPVALIGLFVVGFVLAVAYRYAGNLWVPIIGHAVFNSISLSLALLVDRLDLDELVGLGQAARLLSPLARYVTGG